MKRAFLLFLAFGTVVFPARANWEYSGGRGYGDDGGRLTISVRGGVVMPFAKMKNDVGVLDAYYCADGTQRTGTNLCEPVKMVEIGKIPVAKKYGGFAFAGGASVGMVLGGSPKIRMELDWLHITETNYDTTPLFSEITDMPFDNNGTNDWYMTEYPVGSVSSTVQTDIISAMFYYDFFDGTVKRAGEVVPYVGFGLGYATATTILSLSDAYGDFTGSFFDKFNDGVSPVGQYYYTSQTQTNSFAVSGALGMAYGLDTGVFFDVGARASYVPRIRWALNNGASTSTTTSTEKNVFSAENIIFLTVYAGLRFEF